MDTRGKRGRQAEDGDLQVMVGLWDSRGSGVKGVWCDHGTRLPVGAEEVLQCGEGVGDLN